MNEEKITHEDFNAGINTLIEILKAQPNLFMTRRTLAEEGKELAEMVAQFSLHLMALKTKHCSG